MSIPPPPPPPSNQPHIMLSDAFTDEDASDEEFSMSRSRGPSFVYGKTPKQSLDLLPPPPPCDDDFMLSLDELDRMQQQRKATQSPGQDSAAFRSSLRQSFSYNSKPLLPPLGSESNSPYSPLQSAQPLPIPQPPAMPSLSVSSSPPPHPPSTTPSQSSTAVKNPPLSLNTAITAQTSAPSKETYGATLNGEIIPYKMPIDGLSYPTTVNHGGTSYPATLDTLPKSPFLNYTPQHGREFLHFQQVITSVDEAIRQARSGQYSVKRLVKFIEQWCLTELRHVESQASLIAIEAYKSGHSTYGANPGPDILSQEKQFKLYSGYTTSRPDQCDDMHRTQRALISVYNTMEKEMSLRRRQIAAAKKLTSELQSQSSLLEHRIKKCYEDYKQFTSEKVREIAAVRKLEKECQSLLKQAKQSLGLEKEEEDERQQQARESEKSKFKLLSSKLQHFKDKAKVSLAGGPKEFCDQLATLSEQYLAAIEKGNQAIHLYQTRCHKLLGNLALIEAERVVLFNFTISQFAKTAFLTEQPVQLLYHNLLFSTFEMDPQYDFQEYLRRHRTSHGAPTQEPQEVYRLPVTPEDIRAMRLDVNPNSVFKVSLNQCMRIQAKDHPTLQVPRIMHVLIDSVKTHNGLTSEGIFRISHQREELVSLRKQFENGNYDMPSTINSPHAAAALLKEWLRELADSLIPTESYSMWMSAAKQIQTNGPGIANLAQNGGPAPAPNLQHISKSAFAIDQTTEAQILNLYSLLDDNNQNVIREIAILAVEISHPLHQRVNRMTVENLAIVFAPSFFRNPSDDTNDILLNSKNETKMTALLLSAVGMKFFDSTELDKIYYLLPPSQQLGGNLATGAALGPAGLSDGLTSPTVGPGIAPPSFFQQASSNPPSNYDDGRISTTSQTSTSFHSPQANNGSYRPPGAMGIPEHSTSNSTPPSSHSHFGSPAQRSIVPPPPHSSNSSYGHTGGPITPMSTTSTTSGFFTSPAQPPPYNTTPSGQPPPGLPPRRGTFMPGVSVLPQHPSQSRLGQ